MKTIQLKLFTFKELGRLAKQRALTEFRAVNVEFNWWNDEYEDFMNLCQTLAITVDRERIHFRGFYSQGDGASFTAIADLPELVKAIEKEAWKQYAPLDELKFPALRIDRRVRVLLNNRSLDSGVTIKGGRGYWVKAATGIFITTKGDRSHDNIFGELEKLDAWLQQVADNLNAYLYKKLQSQYEFLTSDTAVKESILFNEYLFSADGRAANHLYELAKHHHKTE